MNHNFLEGKKKIQLEQNPKDNPPCPTTTHGNLGKTKTKEVDDV